MKNNIIFLLFFSTIFWLFACNTNHHFRQMDRKRFEKRDRRDNISYPDTNYASEIIKAGSWVLVEGSAARADTLVFSFDGIRRTYYYDSSAWEFVAIIDTLNSLSGAVDGFNPSGRSGQPIPQKADIDQDSLRVAVPAWEYGLPGWNGGQE